MPDSLTYPGLDAGASLAIERGSVVVDPNASVPVDPDSPRSRMRIQPQARRVWVPDTLIRGRNPALQTHHHDAATHYLEDWLIGEQATALGPQSGNSPYRDPWNRLPFSEARAIRRDRWRRANRALEALGPDIASIVTWTVLQITPVPELPPTVEAWARSRQPKPWGTERSVGVLIAALEVLATHYGLRPGARRRGKGPR